MQIKSQQFLEVSCFPNVQESSGMQIRPIPTFPLNFIFCFHESVSHVLPSCFIKLDIFAQRFCNFLPGVYLFILFIYYHHKNLNNKIQRKKNKTRTISAGEDGNSIGLIKTPPQKVCCLLEVFVLSVCSVMKLCISFYLVYQHLIKTLLHLCHTMAFGARCAIRCHI